MTSYLLWKTAFGLRLRSAGENPWAADSLGVKVVQFKYAAVVFSGMLAGLGGAYLSILRQFTEMETPQVEALLV